MTAQVKPGKSWVEVEAQMNKPKTVARKAWAYKTEGRYTGACKYKCHSTDIPCTITYNPKDVK